MFSLTSRKSASLRAARCSHSDDTIRCEVSRYRTLVIIVSNPKRKTGMAIRVQIEQATPGGNRAMDVRAANDRIADKAEQLRFVSQVPMLCECSTPACRAIVMISLYEYRRIRDDPDRFLTAPGHHIDGAETQRVTEEYAILAARRSA